MTAAAEMRRHRHLWACANMQSDRYALPESLSAAAQEIRCRSHGPMDFVDLLRAGVDDMHWERHTAAGWQRPLRDVAHGTRECFSETTSQRTVPLETHRGHQLGGGACQPQV
jgi:hypothetical protein